MLTLRRSTHDTRIEIMPLIDVVFLLLTFFIYAMVLMVPAMVMPMQMRPLAAGATAEPVPAVTISIDARGELFFDREPIALEQVLERLEQVAAADPNTSIYIAVEDEGAADRLPVFMDLCNHLANSGLEIKFFSSPRWGEP